MGRPSTFTQKIADEIAERLAEGESLRSICGGDKMPRMATVFRWLADERYSSFREQYERARETQADALADEIVSIADDTTYDTTSGKDGTEIANTEWISRSKLRVDARKWVASKLKPKKYGDKLDLTSGGEKLGLSAELEAARRRASENE